MKRSREETGFLRDFTRALVLCPHTDDELGCAGTISRLVESGVVIRYIALSRCEISVPDPYPSDILEKECRAATSLLGVQPDNVEVWDFPVRSFPHHRQEILEKFVAINRSYKPDLVLLPAPTDIHQDHSTVSMEGVRAFKHTTLMGYELIQNTISSSNTAFVRLSAEHLEQKINAMACYKSQAFRTYAVPEFIRGLAKVRGVQSGHDYAEAFELIRLII